MSRDLGCLGHLAWSQLCATVSVINGIGIRVGLLVRVGVGRSVGGCAHPSAAFRSPVGAYVHWSAKLKAVLWHDSPHLMHYTVVCDSRNEK
jgi:hypothetical protein